MTYQFPADLQQQLTILLDSGKYQSIDDALRDAFLALRQRSDEICAIQNGIDDMEAGRCQPIDEVDAEIRKKYNIPQDI